VEVDYHRLVCHLSHHGISRSLGPEEAVNRSRVIYVRPFLNTCWSNLAI
jgi:hypothetical protein